MSIPYQAQSLLGALQDFEQARIKADRQSRKTDETRYVIREGDAFYVASTEDLDTFFYGTCDENILYATEY